MKKILILVLILIGNAAFADEVLPGKQYMVVCDTIGQLANFKMDVTDFTYGNSGYVVRVTDMHGKVAILPSSKCAVFEKQ